MCGDKAGSTQSVPSETKFMYSETNWAVVGAIVMQSTGRKHFQFAWADLVGNPAKVVYSKCAYWQYGKQEFWEDPGSSLTCSPNEYAKMMPYFLGKNNFISAALNGEAEADQTLMVGIPNVQGGRQASGVAEGYGFGQWHVCFSPNCEDQRSRELGTFVQSIGHALFYPWKWRAPAGQPADKYWGIIAFDQEGSDNYDRVRIMAFDLHKIVLPLIKDLGRRETVETDDEPQSKVDVSIGELFSKDTLTKPGVVLLVCFITCSAIAIMRLVIRRRSPSQIPAHTGGVLLQSEVDEEELHSEQGRSESRCQLLPEE
jgi:hypothetical protein